MTHLRIRVPLAFAICLGAPSASADELSLLLGSTRSSEHGYHARAWALDYQHNLSPHLALGISHVNEGHATNSHRDGAAVQLRARATVFDPRLTLVAGIGPFQYFNTQRESRDSPDEVHHGWGVIYSLAATWELGRSWFLHTRVQHIEAHKGFDATSILVGGGYRFGDVASGSGAGSISAEAGTPRHEIGVFAGRVIANTFESQTAPAQAIEYRGRLAEPLEWSVTALNEGDTGPVRRYGIASQLWVTQTLGSERFRLGAGVGPYALLRVRKNEPQTDATEDRLAGIASLTMAYDVTPAWRVRFIFNRVFAEHSRDTDVILLGVGHRY